MDIPKQFSTARLILRNWRSADLPVFAQLNNDSRVMSHFPSVLTREQSDTLAADICKHFQEFGWGLWAVENKQSKVFMGFVGLCNVRPQMPFAPNVEIGWRLASSYWGKSYATEAATKALTIGFDCLGLPEIIAYTTLANLQSQAVMERLNMARDKNTFEHPTIQPGHPLRVHCVYRISCEDWLGKLIARK